VAAVATQHTYRPTVPYTFFRQQVVDNNVRDVSSRGDVIQGDFRMPVAYPAHGGSQTVRFRSVQPSFATDDQRLLELLVADHVSINAHPIDQATPFWEAFPLGLAPLILLIGVFVWLGPADRRTRRRADQLRPRQCKAVRSPFRPPRILP
jgi:hypothetical protein